MQKGLVWIAAGVMLAGCGGGSDDDNGSSNVVPPPVAQQPAPAPVTPPPAVSLLSGAVTRHAAANTAIAMDVVVKPNFTPAGILYASAADNGALLAPAVAVTPHADGSYTLAVNSAAATSGAYSGEFTIKLCSDPDCATPQAVPSIKVPYAITVSAAGSAWPGDKPTPLAPWTDVADWSTFQGNAAHTGYVPVTLNPDQFALRWKIGSVNPRNASTTSALGTLVAANGVFYTARDNKLQARKELDGSLVWTYDLSSLAYPTVNPPAVDNGVVYMVAGQQQSAFMFGLDAATGSVVMKSAMPSQWGGYMAPVATGNAVYTSGGGYGGLYAFGAGGDTLFKVPGQMGDLWSPAVDANSVYVYGNNSLAIYDRKSGDLQGKIDDLVNPSYSFGPGGAPVLGSKGMVLAASYSNATWSGGSNALMKFNVEKGYIDWRVNGAYSVTPAYADGVVYALNKSPMRLEVRAESDAALRWSWTPPIAGETLWNGEPVVTKNMVFVSTDRNTYAIDLRTRKPVWSYPLAGRLALSRSGILYIHSEEALVAIGVK